MSTSNRLRLVLLLVSAMVLLFMIVAYVLAGIILVIEVKDGGRIDRFIVVRGSEILILFNNSVTGSPVKLIFKAYSDGFRGVGMTADEATIEYYTSGIVDVNGSIRYFKSSNLLFCTSYRVKVMVSHQELIYENTCLEVRVKPYIGS